VKNLEAPSAETVRQRIVRRRNGPLRNWRRQNCSAQKSWTRLKPGDLRVERNFRLVVRNKLRDKFHSRSFLTLSSVQAAFILPFPLESAPVHDYEKQTKSCMFFVEAMNGIPKVGHEGHTTCCPLKTWVISI